MCSEGTLLASCPGQGRRDLCSCIHCIHVAANSSHDPAPASLPVFTGDWHSSSHSVWKALNVPTLIVQPLIKKENDFSLFLKSSSHLPLPARMTKEPKGPLCSSWPQHTQDPATCISKSLSLSWSLCIYFQRTLMCGPTLPGWLNVWNKYLQRAAHFLKPHHTQTPSLTPAALPPLLMQSAFKWTDSIRRQCPSTGVHPGSLMTADKWREGGSWDSVTGSRGKTTQDQLPRAASAFLLNKPGGRSGHSAPVLQLCWHCPALVRADGRWADGRRPFHHRPHALIPEGQSQVVLLPASP